MSGKKATQTRKPRTVEVLDPRTGETFEIVPISEVYPRFVEDYKVGREHALRFQPVPASSLLYDRSLTDIIVAALSSGILPESVNVSPPKIAHIGAMSVELVRLKDGVVVATGLSKLLPTHPASDPNAVQRLRASAVRDLLTTLGYIQYSSSLEDADEPAESADATVDQPEPEDAPAGDKPEADGGQEKERVKRRNLQPTRAQLLSISQYAEELGVQDSIRQPADRDDARALLDALRKARNTGDEQQAGVILKPFMGVT